MKRQAVLNFNRPITLKAINGMVEKLSDDEIAELWGWLEAKFPKKKSNSGEAKKP